MANGKLSELAGYFRKGELPRTSDQRVAKNQFRPVSVVNQRLGKRFARDLPTRRCKPKYK